MLFRFSHRRIDYAVWLRSAVFSGESATSSSPGGELFVFGSSAFRHAASSIDCVIVAGQSSNSSPKSSNRVWLPRLDLRRFERRTVQEVAQFGSHLVVLSCRTGVFYNENDEEPASTIDCDFLIDRAAVVESRQQWNDGRCNAG